MTRLRPKQGSTLRLVKVRERWCVESAPARAWRGFHVVEVRRKHWPCILLGCLTRAEAALFGLIGRQLSEILRLAASIQQGTVTASLILRKLGSYPRQNSPALALREIGRIERTLFAVAWIEDPSLRRRVTAGLNKGEARNSLARAVFFNRLGEIRDRSFENQRYRASGEISLSLPLRFGTRSISNGPQRRWQNLSLSIKPCFSTSLHSAGSTST